MVVEDLPHGGLERDDDDDQDTLGKDKGEDGSDVVHEALKEVGRNGGADCEKQESREQGPEALPPTDPGPDQVVLGLLLGSATDRDLGLPGHFRNDLLRGKLDDQPERTFPADDPRCHVFDDPFQDRLSHVVPFLVRIDIERLLDKKLIDVVQRDPEPVLLELAVQTLPVRRPVVHLSLAGPGFY